MASHSGQDYEYSRRYLRGDVIDERDPRYFDNYGEVNVRNRDLVPRADPRDSSLSVEEVRRDFPPPSGRDYVQTHDVRRARSAEPGYYQEDYEYRRTYGSRLDARESDRHSRYAGSSHGGDDRDRKPKHTKTLSKQEKLIAAVAGAALLVGGKELYDRHEAKKEGNGTPVQRNALSSAALAGFGALAAYGGAEFYSKQQARKDQKAAYILQRGRDGRIDDYYESDGESDTKEKKGHKNFLESAIAATGLGAAVKSLTGLGDDKHSDTRSRGGSPSSRSIRSGRSRSSSRSGRGASKVQKAAIASLLAGATEAFRVAKEPGGWRGEKTKRILTAAAGAATVDAAHGADHGKLGLAESVIGGLVGNRLINGSRNDIEEDRRTGRSRSRSRARSKDGHGGVGLAALATAGLGALGAKKAFDRSRSRGRDRSFSRSPSRDRDRHRSRSRSVVDKARDGLAKLGFGSGALVAADDRRRRDYDDDYDDRSSRHSGGRRDDDHVYDDPRYRRRGGRGESRDRDRSRSRDQSRRRGGYGSESDLGDSSEDERRAKKMRGKQIITTGLATVATVHAAHGVYKSMEKRKARKEAVKEGLLSSQEAKKLRAKAIMQDAASIGIAAIGIKGALSELKEARDMTHECREWRSEKERRHEKRAERQKRQKLGERKRSSSWSTPSRPRNDGYYGDNEDEVYILDRRYSAVSQLQPPVRRDSR
ncbi:hypothetical protein J3E69DRAFT_127818 [Trichoderma sp. SZMC 28015]